MPYQSRGRTESVSTPSSSGGMWGGLIGGLAGLALAPLTAGTSLAIPAATGFAIGSGVGSAIGQTAFSDTQQVQVGGSPAYGTTFDQAMQAQPTVIQPMPLESPAAYKARLDAAMKQDEFDTARSFYA